MEAAPTQSDHPRLDVNETNIQTVNQISSVESCNFGDADDHEDWFCAICMDYLMDAVQTGCSHKFCKFCIDRWILVNPGRRCPVCRSVIVGTLCSLPELDSTINTFLQNTLTPEELSQRNTVRSQRENAPPPLESAQSLNFDDIFESRDSVETQLVSHAIRNSIEQHGLFRRAGGRGVGPDDLYHTSTFNPTTAEVINRLRQSIERLQEFGEPYASSAPAEVGQQQDNPLLHQLHPFSRGGDTPPREVRPPSYLHTEEILPPSRLRQRSPSSSLYRTSLSGISTAMMSDISSSDDIRGLSRLSRIIDYNDRVREMVLYNQQVEDDLMAQYNYHVRRVQSAYSRIVEAQQDYHYHSDEILRIHQNSPGINNNQQGAAATDNNGSLDQGYNSEEYPSSSSFGGGSSFFHARRRMRRSRGRQSPTNYSLDTSTFPSQFSVTTNESRPSVPDYAHSFQRHVQDHHHDEEHPRLYSQNYSRRQRRLPPSFSRRRTSSGWRSSLSVRRNLMDGLLDSPIGSVESVLDESEPSTVIIAQRDRNSQQSLRITREQVNLPQRPTTEPPNRDSSYQGNNNSSLAHSRNIPPSPSNSGSCQDSIRIDRGICTNLSVNSSMPSGMRRRHGRRRSSVQFQIQREANNDILSDHEISTPTPTNNHSENYRPRVNFRTSTDIIGRPSADASSRPYPIRRNIMPTTLSNNSTVFGTNSSLSEDIMQTSTEQINVRNNNNSSALPPGMMRSPRRKLYKKMEKRVPRQNS